MEKIDALKAVARNLEDLVVDSTPGSLTGSTIFCAKFIHPLSGGLLGKSYYAYSGAGAGDHRTVGSFNPAANEIVFPEGGITASTNTNFILLDYWDKDAFDNAIDRAIGVARTKYLEDMVSTLTLVASQYEYPVPSGMEYISNLRLVPSGHTNYHADDEVARIFELPPRFWEIERSPLGSYMLAIDPRKIDLNVFNNQLIHIMGQAKPEIGATDNADIPVDIEEFVINNASMRMASQRIREKNEWRNKFYMFRDENRILEDYIFRPRCGRQVK